MRTEQDKPHRRSHGDARPRPPERDLRPMEAAEAGLHQITDLTGRDPQGVVSLEPTESGWVVGVEVVEDRRVPSSTDVLALYEAEIDADGELVAYTRKRRYPRGKSDRGEA